MTKKQTIMKGIAIGVVALSLAACTTTRHGKGDGTGADGMGAGAGGANGGAYAEGAGGGAGFQPSASCNVPQTAGASTQAYYFEYDKSDVHPDDMSRLQSLASNAAANHGNLKVVGNTDNRGSREYNIALGWRRANAVASALEQAGVSKQQVNTNSNGAEKPIAFGTSDEDYQCNRRVDVTQKG